MMFIHAYRWFTARQTVLLVLTLTIGSIWSHRCIHWDNKWWKISTMFCVHWRHCRWLLEQFTLQWRHNGHYGISNHQPDDLFTQLFIQVQIKKISMLCVTGLCVGNSTVTSEFPAQMAVMQKMFPFDCVIMIADVWLDVLVCGVLSNYILVKPSVQE